MLEGKNGLVLQAYLLSSLEELFSSLGLELMESGRWLLNRVVQAHPCFLKEAI
jgi:hypothetical protein